MSRKVFIGVSLVLVIVGVVAWAFQLLSGLAITGMSNMFNWGLYIGFFVFLVGIAAGGMIISSSIYLFKADFLKPFAKLASLSAFACAVAAGMMVLVDLGSIQNILNIFIHPNFESPLVWDVIVISCYIVLTFLSVYFQLLPDCKRREIWFFNGWVKKRSSEEVDEVSKKWSRIVALVALPFAVLIHTVTALIFATQNAHEWWHSAVLPPDFIAMAVASGGALVVILAMAMGGKEFFGQNRRAFKTIGLVIAIALAIHFFFTCMELILLAWTGSVQTGELLHMLFGQYGLLYACEILLPLIAMVMLFAKRTAESRGMLVGSSVLVLVGTLAHRLMLLFPELSHSGLSVDVMTPTGMMSWLYPLSTGRFAETGTAFATSFVYTPTFMEVCVAMLPIGIALLILAVMNNKYSILEA